MAGPGNPSLSHCEVCGATRPRVVSERVEMGVTVENGVETPVYALLRHAWLCADCEYKREHPDALLAKPLPRERSAKLQKETLFDLDY